MIFSLPSFIQFVFNLTASPVEKPLAYLDPGSGSFILQIILASLLASLFFMRTFWRKLIDKIRKLGSSGDDSKQDSVDEHKDH
jgi:membrane-anchored glycerophosphoryl diester phosphodiesterase (GDPDase)